MICLFLRFNVTYPIFLLIKVYSGQNDENTWIYKYPADFQHNNIMIIDSIKQNEKVVSPVIDETTVLLEYSLSKILWSGA